MDTKSKSIKPALAFLAFVIGICLLLYSVAAWTYLYVYVSPATRASLMDVFQSDYQQTYTFRSRISANLYSLLDFDYTTYNEEDNSFPLSRKEINLLYRVEKDGQLLASNTDASLASPDALPEGYNFLLIWDGSKASIWKDGQAVDVYGDGFFRGVEEDWDVPGYSNSASSSNPAYAELTVSLAAAAKPFNPGDDYGLYGMVQELAQARVLIIWLLLVPPVAGVALLIWSIVWHKHKVRADQAIAWFTGHIWLELKLLLLVPLTFLWVLAASCTLNLFFSQFFGGPLRYLSIPLALWWSYLHINDLRYNFGHLRNSSFCTSCARLLGRQEMGWSVGQRMDRRSVLQFILCIPFFLYCALQLPLLNQYFSLPMMVLLAAAGAGLIAAQVWLLRENRRTTADMDRLLTRIRSVGGDATTPLPEDSDLRAAAEELDQMEDKLKAALSQQMKSEKLKLELITNVSHDLKTPLTSIISYTELLRQEEDLPDHVRDYILVLYQKTLRLQAMVQDVFDVSKAATGNLPVTIRLLDFTKLLRQTLADLDEDIQASGLALRSNLPDGPVWILADGDRLYRVFQNLIGNALKYALDGSRIYLTLSVEGDRAAAVIQNTSREELPYGVDFTERFVRGDQSRTDGGSGLGLSIARTFTEACGGSFSIRTQADLFTASVTFPLTQTRPQPEVSP